MKQLIWLYAAAWLAVQSAPAHAQKLQGPYPCRDCSGRTAPPEARAAYRDAAPSYVALVTDVRGTVRAIPGGAVARLTWLAEGTRVETAGGASAVVVFASGRRWKIDGASSARITRAGATRASGQVSELEAFPPLPHLPPVASESVRASGYGAVRLRGGHWAVLYPRYGTRTLLASTVLTFEPRQAGGGPYRVEVIDQDGHVVFETETAETQVIVPAGRLKPGARYTWIVRPPLTPSSGTGASEFMTLDRESEASRRALHAASRSRDAVTLSMLAEIDLSLGLLPEARRGFEDALALAPDDAVIRARVGELRTAMVPASR